MKRYLVTAWIVALVAGAAWAQQKKDAPPQPSDNGPSLEVTMKFIQDKLEAKANPPHGVLIEVNPAKCEIVEDGHVTFSFREVEKIEVIPPDEDSPLFTLRLLMTTNKSVHTRYTDQEKKKSHWALGDSDRGSMRWWFKDDDVANRVAKALLHAVELCGGGSKPEPF